MKNVGGSSKKGLRMEEYENENLYCMHNSGSDISYYINWILKIIFKKDIYLIILHIINIFFLRFLIINYELFRCSLKLQKINTIEFHRP